MRVFADFVEAKNEIRRDLNELGVTVFAGYQSVDPSKLTAEQREKLTTKELQDYDYRVLKPDVDHLSPTQPWADAEWSERLAGVMGKPVNPGKAWELRREVWGPLLDENLYFSYTYSDRLDSNSLPEMIDHLAKSDQLYSRQIYVSIWDPIVDSNNVGTRRVPCTLGYQFMLRRGHLDVAYHMRSSDFSTHWDNDVYLCLKLQRWVADRMHVTPGAFVHKIGSLHVYASEVAGVF